MLVLMGMLPATPVHWSMYRVLHRLCSRRLLYGKTQSIRKLIGRRKGDCVRAYRRFLRMAHHECGRNLRFTIPLPVIVYSATTGWHVFSVFTSGGERWQVTRDFSIAPAGSKYEGKLVEHDATGNEVRPWDISITKVTLALLINSALLLVIILSVAHWYRKHPQGQCRSGWFHRVYGDVYYDGE